MLQSFPADYECEEVEGEFQTEKVYYSERGSLDLPLFLRL